jgi:hypothetical protein
MADRRAQPGWREAVLVTAAVVLVVAAAAALTGLVPPLRDLVGGTPVTIAVLVVGTVVVLWQLAARPPTE